MLFRKIVLSLILGFSWLSCSFAGSEDWTGTFAIKDKDAAGGVSYASHSPTSVQFLFFSAGKCIHLGKGANINGVQIKENVDLCTDANIETFISEVQKLGLIVNQTVTPGPTYKP